MAKDVIITPADGDIQFENSSGTEAGKIEQSGDDLVISNAVGDVLIGDGSSDVYIGDGTSNVDIIFEQDGAIKGETASGVTLTIGSSDTTLIVQSPTLKTPTIDSKLTFTTSNGYILFDYEPGTGEYGSSVPLIKVQRDSTPSEQVILERTTENGGLILGVDDTIMLTAGDTKSTMRSNIGETGERVVAAAESGLAVYAFPNNDTSWSNRKTMVFDGVNGLNVDSQPITGSDVKIDDWGSVSASLASINSSAGTIDGSGAANKVAIWSDSDTLTSDTNLHWDSSNDRLGIGITSPSYSLDIEGTVRIGTTGTIQPLLSRDSTTGGLIVSSNGDSGDFIFQGTGGLEKFRITDTGNVGIGNATPTKALTVEGMVSASTLALDSIANAGTDTDKFLVLDSNNEVDFRTGTQVLSDIGGTLQGVVDQDATTTSSITFNDDAAARFGTGNDLRIYHNGTNSLIDNITGDLFILNAATNKDIRLQSDNGAGGVKDYLRLDGNNTQLVADVFLTGSTIEASNVLRARSYVSTAQLLIVPPTGSQYIFPTADGDSGQAIVTDGDGNLSFADISTGGTTISNNTDNYVITGTGTANTLNGESNLTFDGSKLSVGKSSATSPLHVYQNDTNTGTATGITVEQDGTGDAVVQYLLTGDQRWVTGIDNSDSNKFKIASTSTLGSNDRFTIDVNGNVGIGTTAPGDLLDVNGDLNVTGTGSLDYLRVDGNAFITKPGNAELRITATGAGDASLLLSPTTTGTRIGKVFTTNALDLQLGTNNTASIHLDHTDSNVGIGTTTPNSAYKLHVNGATFVNGPFYSKNALTSSLIKFPENTTGNSGEVLVTDSNGNLSFTNILGIGGYSAPPTDPVTFTGTPADNQLAVFTDGDTVEGDSNLTWDGTNLNINGSGSFDYLRVATPSPGNSRLQIIQSGTGGTHLDFQPQSGLPANIQTINATDLRLGTNSTSLIHLDNANSNVGIGTTSPASDVKLDVYGDMRVVNFSSSPTKFKVTGNTAGSAIIELTPGSTGTQNAKILTTNAKDLILGVNNNDIITIDGTLESVGINQPNPTEELDVDGNIAVSGYLTGSFYNGISALGAGTTHSIDLDTAQIFTKTLTADTQFYFTNYRTGVVKDLIVSGDYDLVFNTSNHDEINIIGAASYDGSKDNLIQVLCTDDSSNGKFWLTISRT